ncbi:MAG: YidC/Oxa1 family rane protein insertase [Patescibacteria group bacterium]|nr:YidC/Oxa1 family rane protein insertase [Patescibacteria group bacterium]
MFNTLIVQPLFNLLALIYALLPGHDFGMAIIIFTVVIRILLWPLIKKQLHHTKKLRELQPELKKIKAATKGDRAKESALTMELYKERKINPFATLGLTLLQFPILIGLYIGLKNLIANPEQLVNQTYPFVRNLPWIQELSKNIDLFEPTLFGLVDLNRAALTNGVWYIPALILVAGSAIAQYYQSKQLLPAPAEKKGLRQILKEASAGEKADQSEMQAATGRFTTLMIPVLIFFVTLGIASALSLYWFVSGLIAIIQQNRVLNQDEAELEAVADAPAIKQKKVVEGEVVKKPKTKKPAKKKAKRRK